MELHIQYNSYCVDSKDADEPFGEWYSEYDFSIKGASLTASERYDNETFNVDSDVKAGDPVFVLYMTYSSGDSFGSSEGEGEVLWAFKDATLAAAARSAWKKGGDEKAQSIEFEIDGGRKIKLSNPAWGYFENMSSVDLVTVLVNP